MSETCLTLSTRHYRDEEHYISKEAMLICSLTHLCSQLWVLAQTFKETAHIRSRQKALNEAGTGGDLLQQRLKA